MNTQGEIEAAVCERISRFEHEYMGRGPKDIHAYLIGDLLVVRLQGVLTAAEQQLVGSLPAERGRDLLKQVRTQLIETARPVLEAMVLEVTGSKALTQTGPWRSRRAETGGHVTQCRPHRQLRRLRAALISGGTA